MTLNSFYGHLQLRTGYKGRVVWESFTPRYVGALNDNITLIFILLPMKSVRSHHYKIIQWVNTLSVMMDGGEKINSALPEGYKSCFSY